MNNLCVGLSLRQFCFRRCQPAFSRCGCLCFRLKNLPLLGCFRSHDCSLVLRLGRLDHRCLQLLLSQLNFDFPDGPVGLRFHLRDLDLLGNQRLFDFVLLQFVRKIRLRFLHFCLQLKVRLFDVQILLEQGFLGASGGFRFNGGLMRIGFGNGGFFFRLGLLDLNVAFRFRFGNAGIAADTLNFRNSHVIDIPFVVGNFLNSEADHLKPHLVEVFRAGLPHLAVDFVGCL
ncbi:hypothetical protein D3C81_1563600 [compost metagenome]